MYTLGIDIGSSSSKAVLLKNGSEIIAEDAIQAGTGSSGPSRVLQQIMQQSGLELNEIDYTIATGYGRFSVPGCCRVPEPLSISAVRMLRLSAWILTAIS